MTENQIPKSQTVIDALIALAARDGLGEEVVWEEVELAILDLLDAAVSTSNLRRRMDKLNDAEVALTLTDWFERAADAREEDAQNAARPSDKVLAPMQGVGYGAAVTAAILTATGALPVAASAIIIVSTIALAGGATYGRMRLSRREDKARQDAKAILRMAAITRARGEKE